MLRFYAFLLLAATLGMGCARADLIISAPTFSAGVGEASAFDVLLTNTGTTPVSIGGFTFEIAVPFLLFESATTQTTTAPYIYAGDSFVTMNGLPFAIVSPTDLIASDTPNDGVAPSLLPGATVSLGKVLDYPITANVRPGLYTIAFQIPVTGLADQSGDPLPLKIVNGSINIAPEPGYWPLLAISLGTIAFRLIAARCK